jgi:hypothetical protein
MNTFNFGSTVFNVKRPNLDVVGMESSGCVEQWELTDKHHMILIASLGRLRLPMTGEYAGQHEPLQQ